MGSILGAIGGRPKVTVQGIEELSNRLIDECEQEPGTSNEHVLKPLRGT